MKKNERRNLLKHLFIMKRVFFGITFFLFLLTIIGCDNRKIIDNENEIETISKDNDILETEEISNQNGIDLFETPVEQENLVEEENIDIVEDIEIGDSEQEEKIIFDDDSLLKIEMSWSIPEGPDGMGGGYLRENIQFSSIINEQGDSEVTTYGYNENGEKIYEHISDFAVNDSEVWEPRWYECYTFYSLDYDFDLIIEPAIPENTSDIQTVKGTVIFKGKEYEINDKSVVRGQTGIWYVNVGSLKNSEWLTN